MSLLRKVVSLVRGVVSLFRKVVSLVRGIVSPFRKVVSLVRRIVSPFRKLIRSLCLLPPCKKISDAYEKAWKRSKPVDYHFLPYMTGVLRVLGWAVLVIGVTASFLFGWEILTDGLMVGQTELIGTPPGVFAIVVGIIGSFLAWLFLLVTRDLVCLFIHVKENTRSTAAGVTKKSS